MSTMAPTLVMPKELYTKEEVMTFVYYAYKKQQIDPYTFKGLKFPPTLDINLSHQRGDICVKYWGITVGTISLFDERIKYLM